MTEFYESFVHLIFIGIIALFPVVNPIGSAFMVSPFFENLNAVQKRAAVTKITLYALIICTVALFAGQWILMLFGISIPVVQLAGGIMICKMGWEFLSTDQKKTSPDEITEEVDALAYEHIANKLFYPITFPVTTGAGTISVLFTLSAHGAVFGSKAYFINTGAILISIVVMCLMIYFFYLNTKKMIHYLGSNGENIVNRISAFLIFCVGLQIGLTGLKSLFKI
ncbi:MarC family protein [Pedobacter nyackensis]|uniref:MarC family protein n=1 Tax=Pedobacter nyackensis TaxID=475255 RepID=UPI00292CE59F|nr:MarC family protein [Pedobacter nyackensis]